MKWSHIRSGMKQQFGPPPARPATDVWADFEAHARLGPGPDAEQTLPEARPVLWGRWIAVATSLAVVGILLWPRAPLPSPHALLPPAVRLSNVDSVDVFVDHGSLMIIQDQKNGGTLVWLAGTNSATNGGG